MKTTITALALATLFAPSSVVGYESMLGREDIDVNNKSQRRLGGWWSWDQDKYAKLWYRCCNTGEAEGAVERSDSKNNAAWRAPGFEENKERLGLTNDDYCNCPVRGSASLARWGPNKGTSYFKIWQDKCAVDGKLYNQAGRPGATD